MAVAVAAVGREHRVPDFRLRAPQQTGVVEWTLLFPTHEFEGVTHESSSLTVKTESVSHPTSMAVWAVPSPVITGDPFNVMIGVRCSALCSLTGQRIQVCDEAGTPIGGGRLSETPWPGTEGLYTAEVTLTAPDREGMFSWSAQLRITRSDPPHRESVTSFTFRAAEPPEHSVTVTVIQEDVRHPLNDAEVRFGVYRARTDEHGLAILEVAKGTYQMDAWKTGFETVPQTVEVIEDITREILARPVREPDPEFDSTWM